LFGDNKNKVLYRAENTSQEFKKNEERYTEQFFKTVIKDQTEIRHNSEWLKELNFNDVINLTKQFTISQMLDRETFMIRYKAQKPIGLDEFMYPLMQGYDSVALNCDVEFGGTDQTFNLLAGRKLMPVFGLTPQSAVVMKLLTGSDGRPMGKSLKNYIPVSNNEHDMYGKVMAIVDDIIFEYFELATRVPLTEIEKMKRAVKEGENPMKFKKLLAKEIVTFYHSKQKAEEAEKEFEKTVQNKEATDVNTREIRVSGKKTIIEFLKLADVSRSTSNIKDVIRQGGVEINGQKVTNIEEVIDFTPGTMIKFGKREFLKVL
jgi:tyrosyl-tRNA synthetase